MDNKIPCTSFNRETFNSLGEENKHLQHFGFT